VIRPDLAKWGQHVEDLDRLAIEAEHARTRERFQALAMIARGVATATSWALGIGRHDETVMSWIHSYNAEGPESLIYSRTGGRRPLFVPSSFSRSGR
jgi:transposase